MTRALSRGGGKNIYKSNEAMTLTTVHRTAAKFTLWAMWVHIAHYTSLTLSTARF